MLAAPVMLKRMAQGERVQRAGAWVLAAYLGLCLRSASWQIEGESLLTAWAEPKPLVVAFWHECLPLMPALWLRVRRINPQRQGVVLVSRHRDGRFIGAIMDRFGMGVAHGSRPHAGKTGDKGGAAALRGLLAALAEAKVVAVTPDGPRGPAHVAASGTTALAALSGAPVMAVAARLRPCIRLRSWDRMILPLPFARGVIVMTAPVSVARDAAGDALPAVQAALNAAAARAEALCAA